MTRDAVRIQVYIQSCIISSSPPRLCPPVRHYGNAWSTCIPFSDDAAQCYGVYYKYAFDAVYSPPTKEEINAFARVPLSVCTSVSKITQNACMDLDEMLHVDRCLDMGELINF